MTVWHLKFPAWENVKLRRNSFGTAYVISVCSCVNCFLSSCLHKRAVNMYWKILNCGLSGVKALSVPDVVCAHLHKIRKHRQQDQSSNRLVKSDQKGPESSSSSRTPSGIILLTSSLSGMNSVLSKIWLLSCWECGFEFCKGHAWPSPVSVVCCLVEMSLHWADHSSREILPSVVCLTQCDQEALEMRGPWPTRGCHSMKTKKLQKIMQ